MTGERYLLPVAEDATATPPPQPSKRRNPVLSTIRELSVVVVVALVLSLLIKTFLFQPFWIPSGSMNSTLVRGDRVIVSKLTPKLIDLKRGDVVVFSDPNHWLAGQPTVQTNAFTKALEFVGLYPAGDDHLIKRVIGLPGDHITGGSGKLSINGQQINEPYVYASDAPSEVKFDIVVPAGRVWVMGDHRGDSSDSRFHDDGTGKTGSVPESDIVGRAVAVAWPVDRMTWLSDYSTTFAKVPNP